MPIVKIMKLPKIKFDYPTYIVGGWVRDYITGRSSKDIDLCMVVDSFDKMRDSIVKAGGEIFLETPQYMTIRCKIPNLGAVDVAMARKDGDYSDGRRPDSVGVAKDIIDDLSRRDFRMNAMAIDLSNGELIDPFGGQNDLRSGLIETVGSAKMRFNEDYLRVLRAIRFKITLGMFLSSGIELAIESPEVIEGLKKISTERVREELFKCFNHDTVATLSFFFNYDYLIEVLFEDHKIKLIPTIQS